MRLNATALRRWGAGGHLVARTCRVGEEDEPLHNRPDSGQANGRGASEPPAAKEQCEDEHEDQRDGRQRGDAEQLNVKLDVGAIDEAVKGGEGEDVDRQVVEREEEVLEHLRPADLPGVEGGVDDEG